MAHITPPPSPSPHFSLSLCYLGPNEQHDRHASSLGVANLAGHIVPIDDRLLQEHVQTSFVLGQRMAGDLVDETLQSFASVLDELLVEDAFIAAKRKLAAPRFAGQDGNDDLGRGGVVL